MTRDLAIETHDLSRSFGGVQAVDGLELRVPKGGVFGFLGPNGAGKTTTIRLILGLIRADRGRVEILGETMGPKSRRQLLAKIGALVETPALYDHLSGRENLEHTRRLLGLDRGRLDAVLETVALVGDADRRVAGYSLGMRQRLGVALALLAEPELLILDEPTNGLDPAGIREMRQLITDFPREHGVTVFLSSHLLAEVEQVADALAVLQRGRLVFQGDLSQLRGRQQRRVVVGLDRPDEALGALGSSEVGSGQVVEGRLVWTLDSAVDEDLEGIAQSLNARLVGEGFRIHHLSCEQPSLERLFLELTDGRETTDA